MSLLVANTVFYELVIACLLAAAPTNFSPSLVKETTDGVVLTPYAFYITLGVLPYITATQEFVVPRSIPIIAPLPLFPAEENNLIRGEVKSLNIT
jgi:hypothetical protein